MLSRFTHKQSDKLATIQRIKCHAYDRDGAVCTFSQDLKIYTCLQIYIYIIFECSKHSAVWNFNSVTLYFQLFTITAWFISVPNINQSIFGIDLMELYGPLFQIDKTLISIFFLYFKKVLRTPL